MIVMELGGLALISKIAVTRSRTLAAFSCITCRIYLLHTIEGYKSYLLIGSRF
jgi:hypothetical protein